MILLPIRWKRAAAKAPTRKTVRNLAVLGLFLLPVMSGAVPASAQDPQDPKEGRLRAEFRLEGDDLKEGCGSLKSIISCGTTLVTDHPFHVALGSIAPQNGFGFGPAMIRQWRRKRR